MKKYYLVFMVFCLTYVLMVPVSVRAVAPVSQTAEVQEKITDPMDVLNEEASTKGNTVEYVLPYPGILPDHPLYMVKKIRDSIFEYLIVDPIRKIEFYILQSDKHLNMGLFLSNKGNSVLAQQIIMKGQTYMKSAVNMMTQTKAQGKDIPGYVLEKMNQSMLKHEEVLADLLVKAPEAQRSWITQAMQVIGELQGEVSNLK